MAKDGWVTGSAQAAGGSRDYKLWVPPGLAREKPVPLLMLLHGCTHGAEDMAEISGMNEVANRNQFLVVYPEQSRLANLLKCWNWFDPKHQSRDAGEPAILAEIVRQVSSKNAVDPERVFIAGISAGGAMAVIAAALYPDLFSGLGVAAGAEFQAAQGVPEGLVAMKQGGPDPAQQGKAAFAAMKPGLARKPRKRLPVIVFHGTEDASVNCVNADQIVAQWSETNACLAAEAGEKRFSISEERTAETVPGGHSFDRHIYADQTGRLLMEKWIVKGLGHAWSGTPKAHRYCDPKGPNASEEIWRFFCEAAP